jgi:hypothetical protein
MNGTSPAMIAHSTDAFPTPMTPTIKTCRRMQSLQTVPSSANATGIPRRNASGSAVLPRLDDAAVIIEARAISHRLAV